MLSSGTVISWDDKASNFIDGSEYFIAVKGNPKTPFYCLNYGFRKLTVVLYGSLLLPVSYTKMDDERLDE